MPQRSNLFTSYYLSRYVRERLHADLGYSNAIKVTSPEVLKGLKDQLIVGPAAVTILTSNRFEAVLSVKDYHEALFRRHYYGVRRVRRLHRCAKRLLGVKWSRAWALTTAYYSAFFAALELLEATGQHVTYLSDDEMDHLVTRAPPVRLKPPEAGNYVGYATVDVANDEVKITYTKNGDKPHKFAWEQLAVLVRSVPLQDPKALKHQDAFYRFIGATKRWKKPSEVRNDWNYTDVRLFSEDGENKAQAFSDYLEDPVAAVQWSLGKHVHVAAEHEASGIAYLQNSLAEAVDGVAQAVIPPALSAQCAA